MFKRTIIVVAIFIVAAVNISAQTGKENKPLTLKDTITDPSVQIPKDIENNLEDLLIDWRRNLKKSPEYNQLNDSDIQYHDSTYIHRLYSLPTEMELAYNQIVRSYIDMYSSRRRTSVSYMLAKGKYYFPLIEEALDKYELPLELKYLPIIESALNPIAVSRAGATGLWQFMLPTGRMYDLEVNSLVDERRDPIRSTEAAARYLKDLYGIYGDWNLVIAAYNCGPGNVNKAIRRSGGQKDYWAIYSHLPKETRGYVPAFIAATYIMTYYDKHNIFPAEYTHPVSVDTLVVNKTIHLQQISDVLNISLDEIRDLNPQYKKDIVPGDFKKYALCLPSNIVADFINNEDTIFQHRAQEYLTHRKVVEVEGGYTASNSKGARTHRVRKGDTLGGIAKRYGVTVAQLKRLNGLKSNNLSVGKRLVISVAKTPAVTASANEKVKEAVKVQQPQTTATTSPDLVAQSTQPVQSENISGSEPIAQDSSEENDGMHSSEARAYSEDARIIYHKVKENETIAQIASRYNIAEKDILAWNRMSTNKIDGGQRLRLLLPSNTSSQQSDTDSVTESTNDSRLANVHDKQPQTSSDTNAPSPKKNAKIYRVKKGDSLSIIAKRFGRVTVEDIKLANNLKSNKLKVGQELKIPAN